MSLHRAIAAGMRQVTQTLPMIPNGTFDTDLEGWYTEDQTILTWLQTQEMQIERNEGASISNGASHLLSTTAGVTYDVSFEITAQTRGVVVDVKDVDSGVTYTLISIASAPIGTIEGSFTATGLNTRIRISASHSTFAALVVDNVICTPRL